MLDGALAAGVLASAGCGCVMGRAYGPSDHVRVAEASSELVKTLTPDAEGVLDEKSCKAVCGEEAVSCAIASADPKLPPAPPPPRTMSCVCDNHDGKPRFERSRSLSDDEVHALHPDATGKLDVGVCFDWNCCGEHVAMASCRLDPQAPGARPISPDERFVVCHTVTPGGCDMSFGSGRAPPGLELGRAGSASVAEHLAQIAHMERASVLAFGILAKELARAGAPRSLVQRARASARDEREHARVTSLLARGFGAQPARPRVRPTPARSLFQIACENAREGCVRETYGALVAMFQARTAEDARVREAMRDIARDEIRHAELAWDVHAWCLSRLEPSQRAGVRAALHEASATLAPAPIAEGVRRSLGLPSVLASRKMIDWLSERVWRA